MLQVVDVSLTAQRKGILAQLIKTLSDLISTVPRQTRIGFLTFDTTLHYHVLMASEEHQLHKMLVVTDISDPFTPASPTELLPAVGDRLSSWEAFLELLPTLFPEAKPGHESSSSCFGAAVCAAYHTLKLTGGKAMVFSSSRPTVGWGSLRSRDDPRALGSSAEATLRAPKDGALYLATLPHRDQLSEFDQKLHLVSVLLLARSECPDTPDTQTTINVNRRPLLSLACRFGVRAAGLDVLRRPDLRRLRAHVLRHRRPLHLGTSLPNTASQIPPTVCVCVVFSVCAHRQCTECFALLGCVGGVL